MALSAQVTERADRLEVVCRKCDRHGVLSVVRLVQEHGAGVPMTELAVFLAGDCERLEAGKVHDPCGARLSASGSWPDWPSVGMLAAKRKNADRRKVILALVSYQCPV
jgi:hypothetical protein